MRPNPNPEPKESLPPGIKFEHSIVDFFLRGPERRVPTFYAIKPEVALEIVERASRKALREEDLRKEAHKASEGDDSLFDFFASLPLVSRDWTREVVLQELAREVGIGVAQEAVDFIIESVSKEDSDLDLDSLVDHRQNYRIDGLACFRAEQTPLGSAEEKIKEAKERLEKLSKEVDEAISAWLEAPSPMEKLSKEVDEAISAWLETSSPPKEQPETPPTRSDSEVGIEEHLRIARFSRSDFQDKDSTQKPKNQ